MHRRTLLAHGAAASLLTLPLSGRAQALEKPKLTIAVGGKNLLYYLPLTIAEISLVAVVPTPALPASASLPTTTTA